MTTLIFDLESNGLLDTMDTIHSLVIKDLDSKKIFSYKLSQCKTGLRQLADADEIVGHNILKFDIPAIQKVFPDWTYRGKAIDTLVCSRLIWADIKEKDFSKKLFSNGHRFIT